MIGIQDILNKIKGSERIGFDAGSSCTKIVKLKIVSENKFDIEKAYVSDFSFGLDDVIILDEFTESLKKNKIYGSSVAASVDDPSLRIRRMNLAKMPERDLKEVIRWNFREHVDCAIEKYIVSYTDLEPFNKAGRMPLVAYGISEDAVTKSRMWYKKIGLKLFSLEPAAIALHAAFDHNIGWKEDKISAMLNLGSRVSNFVVLGKERLLFSRPLANVNEEALIDSISIAFNISKQEAHQKLKDYLTKNLDGEAQQNSEEKFAKAIMDYLSQLVIEVQRSIDAFCLMFEVESVDNLYVCGGGAFLPGIAEHLTKSLGVPAQIFNPFARIQVKNLADQRLVKLAPIFTVAVGLAIPRLRKRKL